MNGAIAKLTSKWISKLFKNRNNNDISSLSDILRKLDKNILKYY